MQVKYGLLTLLVIIAILIDIITGFLKAKINHNVNSVDATKGFWKKMSLLVGLSFGIFLDILESYIVAIGANELSLDIPFTIPIGLLVGVYIILNECISICENLYECDVKLPAFLMKMLKKTQKRVEDEKNGDDIDGNI